MGTMPVMPVATMTTDFDADEVRVIGSCFTSRGRFSKEGGNMRLRSSKPFKAAKTVEEGCANYVWRLLCFDIVGWGKHVCMPVCADFDLVDTFNDSDGGRIRYNEPGYEDQSKRCRILRDRMDALVKKFERSIPVAQQAGVMRWGRALGMI